MLDLKFIVNNKDIIIETLKSRKMEKSLSKLDSILELDMERKSLIKKVEELKFKKNSSSQEIATLTKQDPLRQKLIEEMKSISIDIKNYDNRLSEIEKRLIELQYDLPNIIDSSVPRGESSKENKVIRIEGKKPYFEFQVKSHYDIGEKLGILDFNKAGQVTGTRFVFLKGLAAQLERALINFMLDTHIEAGYLEIYPPALINKNALYGTGQLPKFEEDLFKVEKFDWFLSPTAEVQVTNYHRDEIIDSNKLPLKYVAYSPCFRSEAGSYGKDTRGLKRQHQFDKVELVKFTTPLQADEELEKLTNDAENILKKLDLHYRVVALCSADLGFSSAKTYDLEVWSPYLNDYVEISSCSNFYDFQARRANIRMKNSDTSKLQYVYTLNGSGLAVGRTLMAIIENYQTEKGDFSIPPVLLPYLKKK